MLLDLVFQIGLEPGELLGAEITEPAALQIDDVDEADEVDAVVVEAVPARALGALAVALQIGLAAILVDDVVLAGDAVNCDRSRRIPCRRCRTRPAWKDG